MNLQIQAEAEEGVVIDDWVGGVECAQGLSQFHCCESVVGSSGDKSELSCCVANMHIKWNEQL